MSNDSALSTDGDIFVVWDRRSGKRSCFLAIMVVWHLRYLLSL